MALAIQTAPQAYRTINLLKISESSVLSQRLGDRVGAAVSNGVVIETRYYI